VGLAEDIDLVVERLESKLDPDSAASLRWLGSKLKNLALRRAISSNHTVMELVVAAYLLSKGYSVDAEREVAPGLVCDLYATKDDKTLVVEVETGFVPPENSKDPIAYRFARELSKVARYSKHADIFAMAVPPFHILQLPPLIFLPSAERRLWNLEAFKRILDAYYARPPLELDDLLSAKLHYVYVVLVDTLELIELTAREYFLTFVERPSILMARNGWPPSWVGAEGEASATWSVATAPITAQTGFASSPASGGGAEFNGYRRAGSGHNF